MNNYSWRKSSRSGKVNCVEVALTADTTAVRDSKDPLGDHLEVGRSPWATFITDLKAGHYDLDLR